MRDKSKSKNIEAKRKQEKQLVAFMIDLYAKKNDCDAEDLKHYAFSRIDKCPFMENKTFCSTCKIHCYQKEYREQIKAVMKYSGPRMLLYKPTWAIKHIVNTFNSKMKKHKS